MRTPRFLAFKLLRVMKDGIEFTEVGKTAGRHGLSGVFKELVVKFWPYLRFDMRGNPQNHGIYL